MLRKALFWVVFFLIATGSVVYSLKYFSHAFPIVTLDLTMNRDEALRDARDLANKYGWGPEGYRQAASFAVDAEVQNFVELEGGGVEAFREMLGGDLYSPYTWRVRHLREEETNEILIRFTPAGRSYGFEEKLPEDEPGASLSPDTARQIAEKTAVEDWQIDLTAYELAEQSQEVRPGGRTDHTFTYERPDIQIGEGRYRLRLVVSGDRLTGLTHSVKVPEAFSRRYEEMRSTNNTIANVSVVAIAVLYILGGCVIGMFYLVRQRWVLWKQPLIWGVIVAFISMLATINEWPLAWMDYDTAISAQTFLLQQVAELVLVFVAYAILLSLVFMAAESLTRKAFPRHIQMWRLWSKEVAASKGVLGRTVGGYLMVSLFMAFSVALYFFASRVLGWWQPSGALFEPDVLATYFPWLSPVAVSLQAGFLEECLFRAVPIAGAALLGQRFGNQRIWIIAAFIIQALVFGAGHANYPQQPAYARVVELIIPSLAFGAIYLYFGLLPAIVMHFAVDVVWFSLPIFVSTASGVWPDRTIVIILTLVPLWVVLAARIQARQWNKLKDEHFNRAWRPLPREKMPSVAEPEKMGPEMSPARIRLLIALGLAGVVIWILSTNFRNYAPSLSTTRSEAVGTAQGVLSEHNVVLGESWTTLGCVEAPLDEDDRFVWQSGHEESYNVLMDKYLLPPHWEIRSVQFEGDVAARAEEYTILVSNNGEIIRYSHKLPESREGASLSEDEARTTAHQVLTEDYGLDPSRLKEVSASPSKLPERTDWVFTFADTVNYPLVEGEARLAVHIAGNEVVDSYRFVHVPEDWSREERDRQSISQAIQIICNLAVVVLFIAGMVGAVVKWTRGGLSVRVFLLFLFVLFGLQIIKQINGWPCTVAGFSTARPYSDQVLMAVALPIIALFIVSAGPALVAGFIHRWKAPQPKGRHILMIPLGILTGVLIAGLMALISVLFEPSLEPDWAVYASLGDYIPILGAGLETLGGYILKTILFLFIFTAVDRFTSGWSEKKGIFSILLVLSVLVVSGSSIDTLAFWLIAGILGGVIYLLAYIFAFRYQLALVPLSFAGMAILIELRKAAFNAHPAAISGSIIAIILIVLVAVYWYRKLARGE
jgi:membrane protease YdiL (CAAX protease family)